MTLGVPSTAQVSDVVQALGELANGFVSSNSLPTWNDVETPGVRFAIDLQNRYRPGKRVTHITYELGLVEAMTQVEALRLALRDVPADRLKPIDVLNQGFYRIKGLDTGGLTSVPLTYGPGKAEGVDAVRLDQIQNGKVVRLGTWRKPTSLQQMTWISGENLLGHLKKQTPLERSGGRARRAPLTIVG